MEPPQNRTGIRITPENERRDIKHLWIQAIAEYRNTLESDAKDLNRKFNNVDDMIRFGDDQIKRLSSWRNDGGRLSKIRSLFKINIGLIEVGTQKLLEAATPAFPPASIISTALTFLLAGCKSVSADFDVVTDFLDDMKSFLERVKILEGNLPTSGEYQKTLTDVFTSLLVMCAFATKFITKGRIKKWVVNTVLGEDSELASARSNVQKSIDNLQQATQYAILKNTEKLAIMASELKANDDEHNVLLEKVLQQQSESKEDLEIIKAILLEQRKSQHRVSTDEFDKTTHKVKGIRTIIHENFDNLAETIVLQESRLTEPCEWLFEDTSWKTWFKSSEACTRSSLLTLYGESGIGKSYLAIAADHHLRTLARQETGNKICVASFFCRRGVHALNSFQEIINSTMLQICDQDIFVHEQINAQFARDYEVNDADYFKLLESIFRCGSAHMLYIIVDAVDELEAQVDKHAFEEMIRAIDAKGLNIKLLVTSRGKLSQIASTEILVDRSKILPDLTRIIKARLNSTDSAFQGIRRLHLYVKTRIESLLVARADGLLYVDVALRYLSNIGREAAIIKELKEPLPSTTAGYLQKDVNQCWRRTPDNLVQGMKILLAWLTFGFESLTLSGANALVQMISDDGDFFIEDEIEGTYGRIIQVASTARRSTSEESEDSSARTFDFNSSNDGTLFDDRGSLITFRYRSTKELLSTTEQSSPSGRKACLPRSEAHMAMFLLCFRIIEQHKKLLDKQASPTENLELRKYAIKYCLRHWQEIDYERHTKDENIVVLDSFAALLNDKDLLATQTEAMGYDYSIDRLVCDYPHIDPTPWYQDFLDNWSAWSQWARINMSSKSSSLTPQIRTEVYEYWTSDTDECMLPIAKAHVDKWLSAIEDHEAKISYYFARKAAQMTRLREKRWDSFNDDDWKEGKSIRGQEGEEGIREIYAIRSLSIPGSEAMTDCNASWATAFILSACGFLVRECFTRELSNSNKTCDKPVQRFRNLILESERRLLVGQYPSARMKIDKALNDRDGVSLTRVSKALNMLTQWDYVESREEGKEENRVMALFKEIRNLDTKLFVPADVLLGEFRHHHYYGSPDRILSFFSELTQTQRLTLLSSFWVAGESWVHRWLQIAAREQRETDKLFEIYQKVIKTLDEVDSGTVWRRYLALSLRVLNGDNEAAKVELSKALDTPSTKRQFEIFKLDASLVAMQCVNAMSDIIYGEFRMATEPRVKSDLLAQVRALLQQKLPESVQINSTNKIPHLLVKANMVRKIGLPEEWQACLQQAFDIAWENLHDTVDWNDGINVCYLSRILANVQKLSRDAQIVNAAQYRFLNNSTAFQNFLKSNGKEHLYDSESVLRLNKWVEKQPNYYKDVRNGRVRWDAKRNSEKRTASSRVLLDDRKEEYWFNQFFEKDFGWSDSDLKGLSSWPKCAGCDDSAVIDQNVPTFTCLLCTDSVLCQNCHDLRLASNRTSAFENKVWFCCDGDRYLESPVKGWQGINQDGKLCIEGYDSVEWETYLQGVKIRWDNAWVDLWRG